MNFKNKIEELEKSGLKRSLSSFMPGDSILRGTAQGRNVINFSSNNYLGLDNNDSIHAAMRSALDCYPCGAPSARLLAGNYPCHTLLEKDIAVWKNKESALFFPTGFMANIGVVSALADRDTDLFLDKYNHASIVQGAILSRAELKRYPHNNLAVLETLLSASRKPKKIVVTDSLFSMDGDFAVLDQIAGLCRHYNALLIIDEAHAAGIFGKEGRGAAEMAGIPDTAYIETGTCSKAVGLQGGYVAASREITDYLVNRAASFIYTTSTPPVIIEGIRAAIKVIRSAAGETLRQTIGRHIAKVRAVLPGVQTQIIPLVTGTAEEGDVLKRYFLDAGLLTVVIRPPTVPAGTARIRLSLSAGHTEEEIDLLISVIKKIQKR